MAAAGAHGVSQRDDTGEHAVEGGEDGAGVVGPRNAGGPGSRRWKRLAMSIDGIRPAISAPSRTARRQRRRRARAARGRRGLLPVKSIIRSGPRASSGTRRRRAAIARERAELRVSRRSSRSSSSIEDGSRRVTSGTRDTRTPARASRRAISRCAARADGIDAQCDVPDRGAVQARRVAARSSPRLGFSPARSPATAGGRAWISSA